MAEDQGSYNIQASFITQDNIIDPNYVVMSGNELRNLYISKAYASQVVDWVEGGTDPSTITPETLNTLTQGWTTESESVYPGLGDYTVRLLDDEGNPVPVGSEVAFIVENEDIPVPPTCSDRVVVLQICNENSITDDNFDIYLNGYYIGAVDLSAMSQVGSVFIASENPALTISASDFACPLVGMVIYRFDPALLRINNLIQMRNTQDNGFGNQGTIGVRNYLLTGTNLSAPCVINDLTFAMGNGEETALSFFYTQCCP
jgi:hypothetical protein